MGDSCQRRNYSCPVCPDSSRFAPVFHFGVDSTLETEEEIDSYDFHLLAGAMAFERYGTQPVRLSTKEK